ncbi:MAG TPA: hypothetical protein VMR28_00550 [Candidatus Saccharimonadales bacterium]|nr:hypothetical protein [Candidatus Saccharimonadales bacterium]
MAVSAKNRRKIIDKLLVSLGIIGAVVLIGMGSLAWWTYSFTSSNVRTQLAEQKIYFPPKGSPELASPQIGPFLDQYAGQQLLTGPEAKAYADHFIAVHLSEVADGQTYAQVSAELQANPTNPQLQQEAQVLFQGETARGLLLGNAYAFSNIAYVAEVIAIVLLVAGGLMLLLVMMGLAHIAKSL